MIKDIAFARFSVNFSWPTKQATPKRPWSLVRGYYSHPAGVLDELESSQYNDDETYVYFYKQPENEEETAAAQRALDVCPTLAIGNDGE